MKSKLIIIGVALITLVLLVSPVLADGGAPSLPTAIYGTVTYHDGEPVPVGTVIVADVNGITSQYVVSEANKIGNSGTFGEKFLVAGDSAGSDIVFTISNVSAEQKGTFELGTAQEVNLVFKLQTEVIDIAPSPAASANFKENPVIITKEGVIVPDTVKVNVDVITDTSLLPQPPANTSNVKTFDIDVAGAESLGGEFGVEIPISISNAELQSSFKNNRDAVVVYHDSSTEWENVPIARTEIKSEYTNFYILATQFSPYMLGVDTRAPTTPSSGGTSSSSSRQTDGTYIVSETAAPTIQPTSATPTATSTGVSATPVTPTAHPTQQSPAPFAGLLAGLGAAALVLARMRL